MSKSCEVYLGVDEQIVPLVESTLGVALTRQSESTSWTGEGYGLSFTFAVGHELVDEPGLPFATYGSYLEATRFGVGPDCAFRDGIAVLACALLSRAAAMRGIPTMIVVNGQRRIEVDELVVPSVAVLDAPTSGPLDP